MLQYNIESFHKRNIDTAKRHAIKEFPEESAGIIVDDKYIPCKNIAENKELSFDIGPIDVIKAEELGKIQAIVHSHDNHPHASKRDMERQIESKVPWIIINLKNGNVKHIFAWGDQLPITDYIGRPFFHGVADCYSLGRDYYKKELNIELPEYPREYGWWKKNENMLMESILEAGFQIVGSDLKDIKQYDGVLARVNAPMINHSGIYIGENGLLLHHLCLNTNSLSRRDPINCYRDNIELIIRHKNLL